MTQVVATSENNTTVVASQSSVTTVVTGIMGPPGKSSISGLSDVNMSDLQPGSILVYNVDTAKWTSTVLLNQQQVDCGEF